MLRDVEFPGVSELALGGLFFLSGLGLQGPNRSPKPLDALNHTPKLRKP